jgi:hypothetical protein
MRSESSAKNNLFESAHQNNIGADLTKIIIDEYNLGRAYEITNLG